MDIDPIEIKEPEEYSFADNISHMSIPESFKFNIKELLNNINNCSCNHNGCEHQELNLKNKCKTWDHFEQKFEEKKIDTCEKNAEEKNKINKSLFNRIIINAQLESTIMTLHDKHPLKICKWSPAKWTAFEILNDDEIEKIKSPKHYRKYLQLFYNFGFHKYKNNKKCEKCNICKNKINLKTSTIEHHLISNCPALKNLQKKFWNKAHNDLVTHLTTPYNTHNMKFAQLSLETIADTHKNTDKFWELVSGVNSATTEQENHKMKFIRIKRIHHNKIIHRSTFYRNLICKVIKWYSITLRIENDPSQLEKISKKHKLEKLNFNFHQWCDTNDDWENFKIKNKITKYDIIIGTDGSFQKTTKCINGKAGVGIYIEHKNIKYYFFQALGSQTINYAELFGLGKIQPLLKRLCIPKNSNSRIFILTDSEYAFNIMFKKKKINKGLAATNYYPILHEKSLNNFWKLNPTLLKVSSHLDEKRNLATISVNDEADILADSGAKYSLEHPPP